MPRWRDAAAFVDVDNRVYEVRADGARRMLADGAAGTLAVSSDRETLAYVVIRDDLGELRVHDGTRSYTWARGFSSLGRLELDAGVVRFFGARPGQPPRTWIADHDGARPLGSPR